MKFIISRKVLLKPLQKITSLLVGKPSVPIISHLLLQVSKGTLSLTATDLEIEMISNITISHLHEEGTVTVPGRKFFDIFRSLPEETVTVEYLRSNRVSVSSGRSRFFLSTLPVSDFPNLNSIQTQVEFTVLQGAMKRLIESTYFSMANQDVRYYLNGMLFEINGKKLFTVATDGHRLAACTTSINVITAHYTAIIPRKGIIELMRILDNRDATLRMQIGKNNIRAYIENFVFTSRLIDGNFPDYRRVFPQNSNNILESRCDLLKQAFTRMAILSNEKYRGVRMSIKRNQLKLSAHNTTQEEAEEILEVLYSGIEMEISLNVNYMLDVLNAIKSKNVRISLTDSMSSIQIEDTEYQGTSYLIMPMRL